jgi:hypothetical protein
MIPKVGVTSAYLSASYSRRKRKTIYPEQRLLFTVHAANVADNLKKIVAIHFLPYPYLTIQHPYQALPTILFLDAI